MQEEVDINATHYKSYSDGYAVGFKNALLFCLYGMKKGRSMQDIWHDTRLSDMSPNVISHFELTEEEKDMALF